MKRAILLLVVVVGGAFYLGWFTFTTDNHGQTEHVNIVIDKDKIHQDEARALEKLHAYERQIENQSPSAPTSAAGGDSYQLPEPPQPPTRQAAETADTFSRGFQ